jgi:hypothetical protein
LSLALPVREAPPVVGEDVTAQLAAGCRLFNELVQVPSAADAERVIFDELTDSDARALALFVAFSQHQQRLSPDDYAAWQAVTEAGGA